VFDWHEPIDWLITSPSLSENATLQFKSKDEYEGDPGFGYYSQTRCDNNAGFIGLAADPESQYGGISGDLCLTASALEQSDITVSLQACEYAECVSPFPLPLFSISNGTMKLKSNVQRRNKPSNPHAKLPNPKIPLADTRLRRRHGVLQAFLG